MSIRIAFFNHKGGVSKTTSVYNIGWKLAETSRVLVVDADPQCNLSSLILGDDFEAYYLDKNTELANLKDGVKAAFEGKPSPIASVTCVTPKRSPKLHLLAGHGTLSEYDAALTFAQTSNNAITTLQNLPGAFSELIRLTEERYHIDFTLVDMNPSLSAINQNFFVTSDAFIIPTNPDPFSLMALNALEKILPKWVRAASSMATIFQDSAYPLIAKYPKFLGTLIQRFNVRNGKAARPFRDNISELKDRTATNLVPALANAQMLLPQAKYNGADLIDGYCLEEISDFQGLLPKAHVAGVPVFALKDDEINETGPILKELKRKRKLYDLQFGKLAVKIKSLVS